MKKGNSIEINIDFSTIFISDLSIKKKPQKILLIYYNNKLKKDL